MPHLDTEDHVSLAETFDSFHRSVNTMLGALRRAVDDPNHRDQASLDIAKLILAVLDNAHSESVSLEHKLERRIMRID